MCDMTSANLEKTLEHLNIQENLRSEIVRSIIYIKEYFYIFFSTMKDYLQAQSKTNHCLKDISE